MMLMIAIVQMIYVFIKLHILKYIFSFCTVKTFSQTCLVDVLAAVFPYNIIVKKIFEHIKNNEVLLTDMA